VRLFINLTPCVPLSLPRRGGSIGFEGASPLQSSLAFSLPLINALTGEKNAS